ncbi:MAG: hypothetical protein AB8B65_16290 [Kordia sp.]|uniref:hypothetical protein n=1 Tax=Kordia sp. TaxID=1965332 RepID=UPI00385C4455
MKSIPQEEKLLRWQREHILRLADHFHEFNEISGQHLRAQKFSLGIEALKIVADNWKTTTQIEIHLGLNEVETEKNAITFIPLFKTINAQGEEAFFDMEITNEIPKSNTRTVNGLKPDIVPESYVYMVTENWNTVDFHLIDDLFVVQSKNSPVRVRSYSLTEDLVKQLNSMNGEDLVAVHVYLGLDMNKFNKTNLTSFTPIFGFVFKDAVANDTFSFLDALNFSKRNNELKTREIFVQYSRPCPPTC